MQLDANEPTCVAEMDDDANHHQPHVNIIIFIKLISNG